MVRITMRNGMVLNLPIGFRFRPSDEELILHYLRLKVFSVPIPLPIIPEADVSKSDPWDLPNVDPDEQRFYFGTKEVKYRFGSRSNRATLSGFWKSSGVDKPIVTNRHSKPHAVVVGMKKTLVFYKGKQPNATKTDWIMHEYSLASLQSLFLTGYAPLPNRLTKENWVVCRIFLKKRSGGNGRNIGVIPPERCIVGGGRATGLVVSDEFIGKDGLRLDLNEAIDDDHKEEESGI